MIYEFVQKKQCHTGLCCVTVRPLCRFLACFAKARSSLGYGVGARVNLPGCSIVREASVAKHICLCVDCLGVDVGSSFIISTNK